MQANLDQDQGITVDAGNFVEKNIAKLPANVEKNKYYVEKNKIANIIIFLVSNIAQKNIYVEV